MLDRFILSWQVTAVVYINIRADILLCGERDGVLEGFLIVLNDCAYMYLVLSMRFTLKFFVNPKSSYRHVRTDVQFFNYWHMYYIIGIPLLALLQLTTSLTKIPQPYTHQSLKKPQINNVLHT